jgi:hypothetical protein
MKMNTRIALFVVALLFAAVEMRAQESTAVRPRVVTPIIQEKKPSAPAVPPLAKPSDTATSLPIVEAEPQRKPSRRP